MIKRLDGRETRNRLSNWDTGSASAEKLASQILSQEGYNNVDPSHPYGGRDGGKDLVCTKNNIDYIVAVYFPKSHKAFNQIEKKFKEDFTKIKNHNEKGFIFVTNQSVTIADRKKLKNDIVSDDLELYHLDRLTGLLDSPINYGLRLEYLSIEMTKEEQISFFAEIAKRQEKFLEEIRLFFQKYTHDKKLHIPLEKLEEFQKILHQVTPPWGSHIFICDGGTINSLKVPLGDLQKFQAILDKITRHDPFFINAEGTVSALSVPLCELEKYRDKLLECEKILTRIRQTQDALVTGAIASSN